MTPEEMQENERQIKQKAVNDARDLLEQHGFDAAIVIATWQTEDGSTAAVKSQTGNWYAQMGMMKYELDRRTQSAFIEQKNYERM